MKCTIIILLIFPQRKTNRFFSFKALPLPLYEVLTTPTLISSCLSSPSTNVSKVFSFFFFKSMTTIIKKEILSVAYIHITALSVCPKISCISPLPEHPITLHSILFWLLR